VAAIVALLALGILTVLVVASTATYFPIDVTLTEAVQRYHSPLLDTIALGLDWPGYLPQVVIITGLIGLGLYLAGRRWEGVMTGLALVLEGALDGLVKYTVQRPRPDVPSIKVYQPLGDYTYPSGHVASYLMVFGFLAYLCWLLMRPSWLRTLLLLVLIGLVVAVGPVRIYLGEHWPSDVAAGYLVGWLGLMIVVRLYWWGRRRRKTKDEGRTGD
jgi:undecaprenyl-diphosphatase